MKKLIYSKEDLDLILTLELEKKDEEIERLHSIIKEVRETIEKESFTYEHITGDYRAIESDLILGILDKENNNEDN